MSTSGSPGRKRALPGGPRPSLVDLGPVGFHLAGCAGGGGFLLGFTEDWEATLPYLEGYSFDVVRF